MLLIGRLGFRQEKYAWVDILGNYVEHMEYLCATSGG